MMPEIYFFNYEMEIIKVLDPRKTVYLKTKMILNGLISSECEIIHDEFLEELKYFGYKKEDNFYIYKIRTISKKENTTILNGIHIMFYDLKGYTIDDIRPKSKRANEVFQQILNKTNWKLVPTNVSTISSANYYETSVLEAFYDALKKWNVEFEPIITIVNGKVASKSIRIVNQLSNDLGKWFEYGDKAINIISEINSDDIYSTFIGRGKGEELDTGGFGRKIDFKDIEWNTEKGDPINKPLGQDYISIRTNENTNSDNIDRKVYVTFSDIEDKEQLLKSTYEYALQNSRPKLELESTVVSEDIQLGEVCTIIRDDINIRYKSRVFEVEELFNANNDYIIINFKFGEQITGSAAKRIKSINNSHKSFVELSNEKIGKVYATANTAMISADGKNTVFRGKDRPVGNKDNDIWFEDLPNNETAMHIWDSSINDWILKQDSREISIIKEEIKENKRIVEEAKSKAEEQAKRLEEINAKADSLEEQIGEGDGLMGSLVYIERQLGLMGSKFDRIDESREAIIKLIGRDGRIENSKNRANKNEGVVTSEEELEVFFNDGDIEYGEYYTLSWEIECTNERKIKFALKGNLIKDVNLTLSSVGNRDINKKLKSLENEIEVEVGNYTATITSPFHKTVTMDVEVGSDPDEFDITLELKEVVDSNLAESNFQIFDGLGDIELILDGGINE